MEYLDRSDEAGRGTRTTGIKDLVLVHTDTKQKTIEFIKTNGLGSCCKINECVKMKIKYVLRNWLMHDVRRKRLKEEHLYNVMAKKKTDQ